MSILDLPDTLLRDILLRAAMPMQELIASYKALRPRRVETMPEYFSMEMVRCQWTSVSAVRCTCKVPGPKAC